MQEINAGKTMRSVVITGASTGIGFATTKLLTARRYPVFGSVRKMADAERLSRELGANFTPLLLTSRMKPRCSTGSENSCLSSATAAGEDAEVISDALTAATPKLRYQITPDPLQQLMVDRLPKRFVDRIIAKRLGLMPPA